MFPLVDTETPLGPQTLSTLERAPLEVLLLLRQQRGPLPKAPAALGTLEGLLLPVHREGALLHKALVTLGAVQCAPLAVGAHVAAEGDPGAQLQPKGSALVWMLHTRDPQREGSLPAVSALLGRQAYPQGEGFSPWCGCSGEQPGGPA